MPDLGVAGPRNVGSITVREVHRSDAREAVHVLALSFADEPAFSHILGGSTRRRYRVLVPFMWAGLRSYPGSIEIHGAWLDGRLVGVGLCMPPGAWPLRRFQELRGMVWGLLGSLPMLVAYPQAIRMFPRMAEQQRRHPGDARHWYLWCVGVHPSFRRRGVASALARFVIDKADADGVGCYLETYGDGTEALYRRFGFEVRDRWAIGRGAPTALARFVIDKADADGVGCYLETYGDGTEALYRRSGFEVRERWEIKPGAPAARTMWREPVSPESNPGTDWKEA